ncbi:MAG: hypothetical protein R3Y47_05100 [Lachnospiraceae bacterium]
MKRKLISVLLTFAMIASMVACGSSEESGSSEVTTEVLSEYVYLPEYIDMGWELTENEYINTVEVQGDTVIGVVQGWDLETYASTTSIYEYDLVDASTKKLDLVVESENASISSIMKTDAGEYIALLQSYFYDEETGDGKQNYELVTYDAMGAIVATVDFTALYDELLETSSHAYFTDFTVDAEGNIYLSGDQAVYVLNPDGMKNFEVSANSWIQSLGIAEDGRVYFTAYEELPTLSFIDVATKGVSDSYANGTIGDMYNGIYITEDMTGMYSSSESCVIYDFVAEESTDLFDWIDVDIVGGTVRGVSKLSDGSVAAIYEDNATWEQNLVIISEVPRSEAPARTELVLATMDLGWDIQSEIIAYNKSNSDYRIVVEDYFDTSKINSDYSNYMEVIDEGITLLLNDLTGTNPPDMIEVSQWGIDIDTLVDKGALEEFTPYLESAGYSEADFIPAVLEACKVDGSLYYIPRDFTVQTMFADAAIVGSDMGWTITEAMDIIATMPENMEFMKYATKSTFMSQVVMFAIDSFIDPETNEAKFDTDEFKALLEIANSFPTEFEYDEDQPSEPGAIRAGELLLYSSYIGNVSSIVEVLAIFGDVEATAIGFPGVSSSGSMFSFSNAPIAITSSSEHKDAVAAFIMTSLEPEEEIENEYMYYGSSYGFPVLQEEFDALMLEELEPNYYLDENGDPILDENGEPMEQGYGGIGYGDVEIELTAPTQSDVDLLVEIINATAVIANYNSSDITELLSTEAESYFSGQKSVDEVASIIQNRVNLYLIENS